MGLYGYDIYIFFLFRGGFLSFNLIYSMLNFYLEDFVFFLFVLLNKQCQNNLNLDYFEI